MLGLAKLVIVVLTASLVSGGALVALQGAAGPTGGSDYGLDTNGNGAYDWLVVRMTLTVSEANYYNVWANLGTREPFGRSCYGVGPLPMNLTVDVRGGYPYPTEDPIYPI